MTLTPERFAEIRAQEKRAFFTPEATRCVRELLDEVERLRRRVDHLAERACVLGERAYVEKVTLLDCGHPRVCLEMWDDWPDEPLCGWCEDVGSERAGAGMAVQVVRTESQGWVEEAEHLCRRLAWLSENGYGPNALDPDDAKKLETIRKKATK